MTGQLCLPDIMQALGNSLGYHWTIAYGMPGAHHAKVRGRSVISAWKPVLAYAQGPYDGPWLRDVIGTLWDPKSKDWHNHGQPVDAFEQLIRPFVQHAKRTIAVCDPFVGGGSSAVAALRLGAHFLGCDVDADAITATRARIAELDPAKFRRTVKPRPRFGMLPMRRRILKAN